MSPLDLEKMRLVAGQYDPKNRCRGFNTEKSPYSSDKQAQRYPERDSYVYTQSLQYQKSPRPAFYGYPNEYDQSPVPTPDDSTITEKFSDKNNPIIYAAPPQVVNCIDSNAFNNLKLREDISELAESESK